MVVSDGNHRIGSSASRDDPPRRSNEQREATATNRRLTKRISFLRSVTCSLRGGSVMTLSCEGSLCFLVMTARERTRVGWSTRSFSRMRGCSRRWQHWNVTSSLDGSAPAEPFQRLFYVAPGLTFATDNGPVVKQSRQSNDGLGSKRKPKTTMGGVVALVA